MDIAEFPHVKRWLDGPDGARGRAGGLQGRGELRQTADMNDPAVRAVLFGQRAR